MRTGIAVGSVALTLLSTALLPSLPGLSGGLQAQDGVTRLQTSCSGGSATGERYCQELALRGQAARAAHGLLASGGSDVPGMAGTLGLRIGSVPRVSLAVRGMLAGANFGGGLSGTAFDPLPGPRATDDGFSATAFHLNAAVGLFDGFSPVPTVGGVAAVDVVGAASFVSLPEDRGFDAGGTQYGAGLRLGLLRESFTLPGVTVSAVRRWGGEADVSGSYGSTSHELTVTSYRLTVGKDLLGVGLVAGGGVDRYSGPMTLSPPPTIQEGPPPGVGSATEEFTDQRSLLFGAASLNYLVLQLSLEAGWAAGMDAPQGRPSGGFDPEAGSWFGSLAVRLTY